MGQKIQVDAQQNLLIELRRLKHRVEERLPRSVRKDTRQNYGDCLQMICGVIDAIIDAAQMNAACKVTVSLIQPHLPGMDDGDVVTIPADDWYDEDGVPF